MYDATKFLFVVLLIEGIAYGLSKALYAQFCTTLSIPFKNIDDLGIYDKSSRNLIDAKLWMLSCVLSISGAWALCSHDDPQYIHLTTFIVMIAIYFGVVAVRSYKIFRLAVQEAGLDWPPS